MHVRSDGDGDRDISISPNAAVSKLGWVKRHFIPNGSMDGTVDYATRDAEQTMQQESTVDR